MSGFNDLMIEPENPQQKIWRYLNYGKFLDLLVSQSIYFSRIDKLDDPFEGSYPLRNPEFELENIQKELIDIGMDKTIAISTAKGGRRSLSQFRQALLKRVFVNCWYMADHENAAMWKMYGNDGIAIQSTFQKFKQALENKNGKEKIYFSQITYIDYTEHRFDNSLNLNLPFFHKHKSFENEQEIRAIIFETPISNSNILDVEALSPTQEGITITIEDNSIAKMIEKIHVAPKSPDFVIHALKDVVKKYGVSEDIVKKSNLDIDPIY